MKCPHCHGTGEISSLKVGEIVSQMRRARGWSRRHLAEVTGIGKTTIGYLENDRHQPTLSTLSMIARAFNIELKEMLP